MTASAQVQLKPVSLQTQEEQLEHSVASERRRMRLIHAEIMTDLLSSWQTGEPLQGGVDFLGLSGLSRQCPTQCVCLAVEACQEPEDAVSAERTRVESVELVLPPHANHQVNTFGGQIMAWMVNVATIAARCRLFITPLVIQTSSFRHRLPQKLLINYCSLSCIMSFVIFVFGNRSPHYCHRGGHLDF